MILDAVRESHGAALAATEERLLAWARRAAELEGISVCPEAGACLAVLEDLVAGGDIERSEKVVVYNTGAAQKYIELIRADVPLVTPPVDWEALTA
jgi:threonine synthase